MRAHGLQPRRRRRYIATTDGDHELPIFPNLARNMIPDGPNPLGVDAITDAESFVQSAATEAAAAAPSPATAAPAQ